MMPFRTPFFLPFIYPSLLWRVPSADKNLYLTFDDGPVEGPTDFVLETLEQHNAKATFFCIGDNIRKYPQVFHKVISKGHQIGNHTYNHFNGWKYKTPIYLENIAKCEDEIGKQSTEVLKTEKLFRPPYGKITLGQIKELSDYKIVMWDVLTQDFDKNLKEDFILKKSIAATRNGSIIVFHDSFKAEARLRYVLPRFLDHFSAQGFSFKSIRS